jgi:hypothetical protein
MVCTYGKTLLTPGQRLGYLALSPEMPGYFRLSLTASDEMIERSIPRFAAAIEKAQATF